MPEHLNYGPCKYSSRVISRATLKLTNIISSVVQEFPFDTARAITDIIHSGVLTRHPEIRFLFSHNGGAFPYLADRIGRQHLDNVITKTNRGLNMRDILTTRNIYFDTSISSPMQYPIMKNLGIPYQRLLYATDYPYTKRFDNVTYLDGYNAPKQSGVYDDTEMEGILRENSLGLFPRLAKLYASLG